MPAELEARCGHWNQNAGRLFRLVSSNMRTSTDYGGATYHTGSLRGREVEPRTGRLVADGAQEDFAAGDFAFSVVEIQDQHEAFIASETVERHRRWLEGREMEVAEIERHLDGMRQPHRIAGPSWAIQRYRVHDLDKEGAERP